MRDFCADFLGAVFDILELSRQKLHVKKMHKKIHLMTVGNFERSLLILGLYLILACAAQRCPDAYRTELSEMKKELALAQKKLLKQKAYVQQLEDEIARGEIALIQREINQLDKYEIAKQILSHEQWLSFFNQQRATLSQIIRSNPACRLEAQEILDKILTLITQLSDLNE